MSSRPPLPPFSHASAVQKVRAAEDAWNSRDPQKVALAYTVDSRWRNRSEFLNVAELVEVFEAVQAKGWDCRKSNGEGLSRVLAADLYPAEVGGFATAHVWLDSRRPNYVDRTINSDVNPTANGCAVLFLNWLHFQHGHSWRRIVAAGAPTLGKTYTELTGRKDGFDRFRAMVDSRFPAGRPSRLAGDNPFPIHPAR